MEFRLTFGMVLRSLLCNTSGILFIILPLCLGLYLYISKKSLRSLIILITIVLFISFNSLGSGYTVQDGTLYLQSGFYKREINLSKAEVFSTSDRQWQTSIRIIALGTADLKTGKFKLKNGKQAIVFSYKGTNSPIIINYENDYYIINTQENDSLIQTLQKYSS